MSNINLYIFSQRTISRAYEGSSSKSKGLELKCIHLILCDLFSVLLKKNFFFFIVCHSVRNKINATNEYEMAPQELGGGGGGKKTQHTCKQHGFFFVKKLKNPYLKIFSRVFFPRFFITIFMCL